MTELKDRQIYKVWCRNLTLAVWDQTAKTFTGIREKFGSRFLDSEFPHVAGGTVKDWEETPFRVPPDLPLDTYLGTECSDCKRPVVHNAGTTNMYPWEHKSKAMDLLHQPRPMAVSNTKLFDFIQQTEVELEKADEKEPV